MARVKQARSAACAHWRARTGAPATAAKNDAVPPNHLRLRAPDDAHACPVQVEARKARTQLGCRQRAWVDVLRGERGRAVAPPERVLGLAPTGGCRAELTPRVALPAPLHLRVQARVTRSCRHIGRRAHPPRQRRSCRRPLCAALARAAAQLHVAPAELLGVHRCRVARGALTCREQLRYQLEEVAALAAAARAAAAFAARFAMCKGD